MYPQERFAYYKRPFWPVLCLKRIGLPCCNFVTTIITCSLQIIWLSNYCVTYNFSTCRHYLAENHLSFPSAPRWVRHSYLSKRLQLTPYTCGSSIHLIPFSIGVHDLFGEDPPSGFKTPHGKTPQDLLTEKNLLLVSSVVDHGSCISLCFEDLAHV